MKQEAPKLMLKRVLLVSEILATVANPQEVEKRQVKQQTPHQTQRNREAS